VFVCIPPEKVVPEMTYTVSGGTFVKPYSLTLTHSCIKDPDSIRSFRVSVIFSDILFLIQMATLPFMIVPVSKWFGSWKHCIWA